MIGIDRLENYRRKTRSAPSRYRSHQNVPGPQPLRRR